MINVTDHSFDAQVLKCDIPVLANFWADWSLCCQALQHTLTELESEYNGKIKVVKLDIEESPAITAKYIVLNLPTLILFKFGREVDRITDLMDKDKLAVRIEPHLDP